MGSYEPETEPWIGIKNQQKPKSEGKALCLGIFFFTHHVIIQHLYRPYILFMLSSSKAHRICSVKGGTVLKLLGRSDLYLS
jgi:hypothetical protein